MKGLLIDANLLCVLIVGANDPGRIEHHPRLKAYGDDDYQNLNAIADRFDRLILCPHVLTETSNLLPFRQDPKTVGRLYATLAALIRAHPEQSIAASRAAADSVYDRLGLTDAVLMLLATDTRNALLSADSALCSAVAARGLSAINYNYVRDGALPIDQIGI